MRFDASVQSAMSDSAQVEMRKIVSALLASGTSVDPAKWSQMADLTTTRAGLLLSGSVGVAHKAMLLETHIATDLTPKERVKELLAFAVSETYFQLRSAVGVAIGSPLQG